MQAVPSDAERMRFAELLAESRGEMPRKTLVAHLQIAGISTTTQSLSNWEAGKNVPGRVTVTALDDILECDGALLDAAGFTSGEVAVLRERVRSLEQDLGSLRTELHSVLRKLQSRP